MPPIRFRHLSQEEEDGASAPSWYQIYYMPLFCAKFNGEDQIIWSFYDNGAGICRDNGQQTTLATPVADFLKDWAEDMYGRNEILIANGDANAIAEEEWVAMDETYLDCYANPDGDGTYLKVGCSRSSAKQLEVISYTNDACTAGYETLDSDDEVVSTGIDVSAAFNLGGE